MTTYKIKEIFYTLQGEGAQSGRPAVFCRFSGCNLWSGREEDRAKAICQFCNSLFIEVAIFDFGNIDVATHLHPRNTISQNFKKILIE
jgi:organic radical activating enzyme